MNEPIILERTRKPPHRSAHDLEIMLGIYQFDGMMGAKQIEQLFFNSWERTRKRLAILHQMGYLNRLDRRTRMAYPQQVYWLTEQGAAAVAGFYGLAVDDPDFRWRDKPRVSQILHDLLVNDFRIAIMNACQHKPDLELTEWVHQGVFWARPDRIEYENSAGKKVKRGIRPDGFFVIRNRANGRVSRLLLEFDRGTEDHGRIVNEKVLPGIAYFYSDAYKLRSGGKTSGRWLFVVHQDAEVRLRKLKQTVEQAAGSMAERFWFTTFEGVQQADNVLTAKIWQWGGNEGLYALTMLGNEML